MTTINEVEGATAGRRGVGSFALRALATWLLGLAIFAGLPLVAWGVDDSPAFVRDRARLAYLVLVFALNAYAAIRIPEVGKARREPAKTVGRQHWAVLVLQVVSVAIVVIAAYSDRRAMMVLTSEAVRYVGIVLYAVGFLTMHWAEKSLGKQFSLEVAIQRNHELVTGGIYRYVRHPRYLGITMFTVGIALVFRSAVSLTLAGAVLAVLLWRIHDEEILLEQEFSHQWRAYAERSWHLIPFVY